MHKVFIHISPNFKCVDKLMKEMSEYLQHYSGFECRLANRFIVTDDLVHKFISEKSDYYVLQGLNIVGFKAHECDIDELMYQFLMSRPNLRRN